MTFTISKKDIVYSAVIGFLIIALGTSFLVYKVKAQTYNQENVATSENGYPTGNTNIPHLNCKDQVDYTALPVSNSYNQNAPYSHTFMADGPSTLDLNGDNLPDYMFTDGEKNISGTILSSVVIGCTYLNNGQGWDRAYICYAKTRSDITDGTIVEAEYRGDCADTSAPTTSAEDNDLKAE